MLACLQRILACALCWLAFATAAANAQSFDTAVARFAADSFGDTEAAIGEVAASGHPMATQIIQALQDGRLLFDAASKKVYVRDRGGKVVDATTGQAADLPAGAKPVRLNNRLRRTIEAALGGLTLLAPESGRRYEAAQAVFKSRDAGVLPTLDTAIAKETDAGVKRALTEARAAVILSLPTPRSPTSWPLSTPSRRAAIRTRSACWAGCRPTRLPPCARRPLTPSRPLRPSSGCGRRPRTPGTACRSAPSCCSLPSALPSRSASWA